MEEPTPDSLSEGQKVGAGRFTLMRELGRGGMGVVWLARDSRFHDEEIAIRFLPPEVASDAAALVELQRETRKSRTLAHPHIVRIHDLYETPGESAFMTMEFVNGPSLATLRLQQPNACFTWEYLRPLVIQLCQALEFAHGEQVIHRDLKPSNLMIDDKGRLKIADFGITESIIDSVSRVTQGDARSGTPPYMSPQQMHGEPPQPTDDIHALGVTLYELLAGKPPFYQGDTVAIMRQVLEEPAPPLALSLSQYGVAVPESVSAAIMASLAKDAAQRPQSAHAFLERILDLTSAAPELIEVAEPVEEPAPMPAEIPKRGNLKWVGIILLSLVMIGIGVFGIMHLPKAKLVASSAPDRFTNTLGQIFVPVPGTHVRFSIWDTRVQDYEAFVNATGRDVSTSICSVKNDKWTEQGDTLLSPGFEQGPTSPVVGASWKDAYAFCKWLTEKERKEGRLTESQSYRLPTDEEWSIAAGDDLYGWGSQWPPPKDAGNFAGEDTVDATWPRTWATIAGYNDGYTRTSPVGTYKPNQFGLYDMNGNVFEWCEDWYRKEMNSQALRESIKYLQQDGGGKKYRVMRGGSWRIAGPNLLLSSCRYFNTKSDFSSTDVGFRCVLDSGEPAP